MKVHAEPVLHVFRFEVYVRDVCALLIVFSGYGIPIFFNRDDARPDSKLIMPSPSLTGVTFRYDSCPIPRNAKLDVLSTKNFISCLYVIGVKPSRIFLALLFAALVLFSSSNITYDGGTMLHNNKSAYLPNTSAGDYANSPQPYKTVPYVNSTLYLSNGTLSKGYREVSNINPTHTNDMVLDSTNEKIFVASVFSNYVTVVNLKNNNTLSYINAGGFIGGLAFDPNNNDVFVSMGNSIMAINASTNRVAYNISEKISSNDSSVSPGGIFYDSVNNFLYAQNNNFLFALNLYTGNLTLISTNNTFASSNDFALDPFTDYIYEGHEFSSFVTVINGANNEFVANISIINSFYGVAFDTVDNTLYGTDYGANTLVMINGSTNKVDGNISTGTIMNLNGILFDNSNGLLYFTDGANSSLDYINTSTDSIIGSLPTGNGPSTIIYDDMSNRLYVSNYWSSNITEINSTTNLDLSPIILSLFSDPQSLTVGPSNKLIYVSNYGSGNVAVIDPLNYSMIKSIAVGDGPSGIVSDPANNMVYVSNTFSSTIHSVSVINASQNSVSSNINGMNDASALAVDINDGTIYVSDYPYVSIYNISMHTLIKNITINALSYGVLYDEINKLVYLSDYNTNIITVINTTTESIQGNISLPVSNPTALSINLNNNEIYVAASSDLCIINGTTNTISSVLSMNGQIVGVSFDSVLGDVFVTTSGGVFLINATNQIVETLRMNLGYSPYNNIYFNGYTNQIYVIDSSADTLYTIVEKTLYPVYFTETGINATNWYLNISGQNSIASSVDSIETYEPNGTYNYSISDDNQSMVPSLPSGIFIVSGSMVQVNVTFLKVPYLVRFIENGLPSGSVWYINLSNGISLSSSGEIIEKDLTDGTYSYSVSTMKGYSSDVGGIFSVSGQNENITVKFEKNVTLILNTYPSSSEVYVNAARVNVSTGSATLSVAPGQDYINASLSGYSSFSNLYTFTSGETFYLNITLSKLSTYGYLVGTATPRDTTIITDGMAIPIYDGHFNQSLSPGTYYVSFTADAFVPVVREINITANHVSYLNESLSPTSSKVTLYGYITPGRASLLADGFIAYVNSSGYYTITVNSGTYTVSVYETGYFPLSENLSLTASREVNFTLSMEPKRTSTLMANNTIVNGFNVTVANIKLSNGFLSLNYTSLRNGTLLIFIPFSSMENVTFGDILKSTVYINGTAYKNYTITISSNYTVILEVYDLNTGDPTLYWIYSPAVVVPKSVEKGLQNSDLYDYVAIGILTAFIIGIAVSAVIKKRRN